MHLKSEILNKFKIEIRILRNAPFRHQRKVFVISISHFEFVSISISDFGFLGYGRTSTTSATTRPTLSLMQLQRP